MIIKKISIENYLCYCGIKEFKLSDGLNIILGENGEEANCITTKITEKVVNEIPMRIEIKIVETGISRL